MDQHVLELLFIPRDDLGVQGVAVDRGTCEFASAYCARTCYAKKFETSKKFQGCHAAWFRNRFVWMAATDDEILSTVGRLEVTRRRARRFTRRKVRFGVSGEFLSSGMFEATIRWTRAFRAMRWQVMLPTRAWTTDEGVERIRRVQEVGASVMLSLDPSMDSERCSALAAALGCGTMFFGDDTKAPGGGAVGTRVPEDVAPGQELRRVRAVLRPGRGAGVDGPPEAALRCCGRRGAGGPKAGAVPQPGGFG